MAPAHPHCVFRHSSHSPSASVGAAAFSLLRNSIYYLSNHSVTSGWPQLSRLSITNTTRGKLFILFVRSFFDCITSAYQLSPLILPPPPRYLEWPSDEEMTIKAQVKLINNYPKYFEPTYCQANEYLVTSKPFRKFLDGQLDGKLTDDFQSTTQYLNVRSKKRPSYWWFSFFF